jgi:hypothetical protein
MDLYTTKRVHYAHVGKRYSGIIEGAQLEHAKTIARLRQDEAVAAKRPDRHGFKGDGYQIHLQGALGELVCCAVMDIEWDASVNTFKKPDVLDCLQVRTRSTSGYDLLIRPTDADDEIFIHVTFDIKAGEPYFTVHGGMTGRDGKRQEWLHAHGGRPPAYFIPAEYLTPLRL